MNDECSGLRIYITYIYINMQPYACIYNIIIIIIIIIQLTMIISAMKNNNRYNIIHVCMHICIYFL